MSAGKPVMLSLIRVPESSRRIVATPFAPAMLTGFRFTIVSLPTGYSIIEYVPSACCTVLVTVVGVVVTVVVGAVVTVVVGAVVTVVVGAVVTVVVGVVTVGVVTTVVGVVATATVDRGMAVKPVGTALRKNILPFGSYAVRLSSGVAINMNLFSGVVAVNFPVPFARTTGPSEVTAPASSTA